MPPKPPAISSVYDVGRAGLLRKPAKELYLPDRGRSKKKSRPDFDAKKALARAQKYLKAAIDERSNLESLVAHGQTHDSDGRRLDLRLQNVVRRCTDLQAVIDRGGYRSGIPAPGNTFTNLAPSDSRFTGTDGAIEQPSPLQLLMELGIPSPLERTSRSDATYFRREGQSDFRAQILAAWKACGVSGCSDEPALQAAHIIPYVNAASNIGSNGICLRADIHCLFDCCLLSIDQEFIVHVDRSITTPEYQQFHEKRLILPKAAEHWPDPRLLAARAQYL